MVNWGANLKDKRKSSLSTFYFIYSAMLVSLYNEVKQPHVYICPFPLAPLPSSHPALEVITEQPGAIQRLSTSCLFHTRSCIYVSAALSIHPTLSSPCVHESIRHLHLYSCPAHRFMGTIFLDTIYMY